MECQNMKKLYNDLYSDQTRKRQEEIDELYREATNISNYNKHINLYPDKKINKRIITRLKKATEFQN